MEHLELRVTRDALNRVVALDYMALEYGIVTLIEEELYCTTCARPLRSVAQGEVWVCVGTTRCYCARCYAVEAPRLREAARTRRDREREQPRPLKQLIAEIEAHRHFSELGPLVLAQYDGLMFARQSASRGELAEQNHDLRQLWKHLYHGGALDAWL